MRHRGMLTSSETSAWNRLFGAVPVSRKTHIFSLSLSISAEFMMSRSAACLGRLGGLQVLPDDSHRGVERIGGAELDQFRSGEDQRQVARAAVVGVAGLVDLVV